MIASMIFEKVYLPVIHSLIDFLYENIYKVNNPSGLFIVRSKALDIISNELLLNKLFSRGFKGISNMFLKLYLSN